MTRPRLLLACACLLAAGPGSARAAGARPDPETEARPSIEAAADPETVDELLALWDSRTFAHRRAWLNEILLDRATAAALAERLLERDPLDLLGNDLLARIRYAGARRGGPTAAEDSAAVEGFLALAPDPEEPGPDAWVRQGAVHVRRLEPAEWRNAMNRARDGYRALGREEDARHAVLQRCMARGGERSPDSMAVDLAELHALAAACDDVEFRAAVKLFESGEALSRSYPEAGRLREEARDLLAPHGPGYQLAKAWWGLGNVRKRSGDPDGAMEAYGTAREMARTLGNRTLEMEAVRGEAQLLRRQGLVKESLARYEEVREHFERTGNIGGLCAVLLDLRPLYHRIGDYPRARRVAEEAVRIARERNIRRDLSPALDGLASEEAMIGRLESARELYEEAYVALKSYGRPSDGIFLRIHLAELYQDLGQIEESERVANEGLELAESLGHLRGQVFFHYLLARIALRRQAWEDALRSAARMEELSRDNDYYSHRKSFRVKAQALAGLGRIDEALAVLESSRHEVETATEVVDTDELTRVLELEAVLLADAGRYEEALAPARAGWEAARATSDPLRRGFTSLTLGQLLVQTGDPAAGVRLLEEGLELAEWITSGITVGEERSQHLGRWYQDYVQLAFGYHALGRDADAFRVLERSRARELRRSLRNGARRIAGKVSPEYRRELEELEAELAGVQSMLLDETAKPPDDRRQDLASLEARAEDLRRRRTEMEHRLQRELPALAGDAGVGPVVEIDELSARLEPGEAILATMVGHDRSLVFLLDGRGTRVRSLDVGEERLRSAVRDVVEGFRAGEGADPAREAGRRAEAFLSRGLLADLDPHAPPRIVRVLPDGPLHRLPFEVLRLASGERSDGDEGARLIEVAEVTYASSATLIARSRAAGRPTDAALSGDCVLVAFGDPARFDDVGRPAGTGGLVGARGGLPAVTPLPFARREVQNLAARFEGACVRIGPEATEAAFFRDAPSARILHVAAHAWVDDEQPGYSGIVLAPSAGEDGTPGTDDGLVQAWEVLRTDLDADLVTLSACETGRGEWLRGEGLIGLARAFRIAGARSLLVSLWEVDDAATAELMDRFYERLLAGESAARALRSAKLSFATDGPAAAREIAAAEAETTDTRGVGRRPRATPTGPAIWAPFVLLQAE
jgi:CHAT domain-containing protein/tetratricopeptide (TPR) repeat protein